jgi:hypothetical protein
VQSCSQDGTATCYWPTMENFRKPTEGSGIFRRESYQRGTGLSSGKGLRTRPPLGHSRRCARIVVVNRRLQKLAPFVRQKQETMSEIGINFANYGWFQVFKLSTRTKPLLRRTLRLWPQPGLIRSRARFAQPRTLIARNRARAPYSCDDNGAAANHHLILLHTVSSAFASSTWRNSLPSSTITKLRLRGTGLFGVLTMADPVQSGLTE